MKKGLIVLVAMLLLAGCSKEAVITSNDTGNTEVTQVAQDTTANETTEGTGTEIQEGYSFLSSDVVIPMNVDAAPIVEALGEPSEYFEAASCAFQGLDKIYTYSGFEINTYPMDGKDLISSVYFLDDSVTTQEGIYLGATLTEVLAAYGDGYNEEAGEYTYTLGQSKLSFIIELDSVVAITYSAIVEGLE